MKTIGIVAEYNPFHNGHAWHIRESLRQIGEERGNEEAAVVAVMSGDFVQRGEAAVYTKYARAEAACRCGADLVVELPLPWAVSSAEGFARGAVALLAALGADTLSFGCEMPECPAEAQSPTGPRLPDGAEAGQSERRRSELEELAELLTDPGFNEEVLCALKEDPRRSYASARQSCAEARLGRPLPLLRQPNSILALEYLKAIRSLSLPLRPLILPRQGAGHDETGESGMPSAFELRTRLREGRDISACLPTEAEKVFRREREAGRTALDTKQQELLMLSRLRFLREEEFCLLPDAADGLGSRLYHAVRNETAYAAILAATATRRYPLARVRRLCVCAALGVRDRDLCGLPPYARVLAFNARGRALLNRISEQEKGYGRIPLLIKPAHVHGLDEHAQQCFALGAHAHDFFTLFYPAEDERNCGEDWRQGPKIC